MNSTTGTKSSPLRVSSYKGHLAVVKFLVEKGADVNSANSVGNSVLMAACYQQRKDVVSFLLDHGAEVNYSTPDIGEQATLCGGSDGHLDDNSMN